MSAGPDWTFVWAPTEDMHVEATVIRFEAYRKIATLISERTGIDLPRLLGNRRFAPVAQARQIAMYFCYKSVPGATLQEVAEFFNKKDHMTVSYAVEVIGDERKSYPEMRERIEEHRKKVDEALGKIPIAKPAPLE